MKWIIFLLISFVIIGYFGNMKEALAIATIEAIVGAYAGLNNVFWERENMFFCIISVFSSIINSK